MASDRGKLGETERLTACVGIDGTIWVVADTNREPVKRYSYSSGKFRRTSQIGIYQH